MKKALVIESDLTTTESLLFALEIHDFRVWHTCEPWMGISIALNEQPDLIFCALEMFYDNNDYPLVKLLRSNPWTSAIPLIVLVDDSEEQILRCRIEAPANSYLTRPVHYIKMLRTIDALLQPTKHLCHV
jgi:DNA-binding response OmpR family regulator